MLSEENIARARAHLGYVGTSPQYGLAWGLPIAVPMASQFEGSIRHILAVHENRVIEMLDVMDAIECQMVKATKLLIAQEAASGAKPNLNVGDDLEHEYVRWAWRLCDLLNCVPNPYSERFKAGRRSNVGNVRVIG
jgi:hypothetical protein